MECEKNEQNSGYDYQIMLDCPNRLESRYLEYYPEDKRKYVDPCRHRKLVFDDTVRKVLENTLTLAKTASRPDEYIDIIFKIEKLLGERYGEEKHRKFEDALRVINSVTDPVRRAELLLRYAGERGPEPRAERIKIYRECYELYSSISELKDRINAHTGMALALRSLGGDPDREYLKKTFEEIKSIPTPVLAVKMGISFLQSVIDAEFVLGFEFMDEYIDFATELVKNHPDQAVEIRREFDDILSILRDSIPWKELDSAHDKILELTSKLLKFADAHPDRCEGIRFRDDVYTWKAAVLTDIMEREPERIKRELDNILTELNKVHPTICRYEDSHDKVRSGYIYTLEKIYRGYMKYAKLTYPANPEKTLRELELLLEKIEIIPFECTQKSLKESMRGVVIALLEHSLRLDDGNAERILALDPNDETHVYPYVFDDAMSTVLSEMECCDKEEIKQFYEKYRPLMRDKMIDLRAIVPKDVSKECVLNTVIPLIKEYLNPKFLSDAKSKSIFLFTSSIFEVAPEQTYELIEECIRILLELGDENQAFDCFKHILYDMGEKLVRYDPERTFEIIKKVFRGKDVYYIKDVIPAFVDTRPQLALELLHIYDMRCEDKISLQKELLKFLPHKHPELAFVVMKDMFNELEKHKNDDDKKCFQKCAKHILENMAPVLIELSKTDEEKCMLLLNRFKMAFVDEKCRYEIIKHRDSLLHAMTILMKNCSSEHMKSIHEVAKNLCCGDYSWASFIAGLMAQHESIYGYSLFMETLRALKKSKNEYQKIVYLENLSVDISQLSGKDRSKMLKKIMRIADNMSGPYYSALAMLGISKGVKPWDKTLWKETLNKAVNYIDKIKNEFDRDAIIPLVALELRELSPERAIALVEKMHGESARIRTFYELALKLAIKNTSS
ncbi:MAG: hypothetical protein GXO25_01980 [Euryarchaeota archaeon]|nr:hypothetical protein [Euryarchaeota archaeon]